MESKELSEFVYELQDENQRLKTAIEELSVLNEISTAISSIQPIEEIIDLIVRKCTKHLKVEQGVIMLLNEDNQKKPFQTVVRKQDSMPNILPFRFDTQLTGWMLKYKTPLLINDLKNDIRFNAFIDRNLPVKSILSVPMTAKGKMIGLLSVFNKKTDSGFTQNDQRVLSIIASQSAQILENARLYIEEQSYQRIQEEMRLAFEIQMDLLPKANPDIAGYDISGKSIPAKVVGGDYYDFINIDNNKIAVCLADISGKGIPAAILMANLQASLRGQTKFDQSCKETINFTNEILFHNTSAAKFATIFYMILNHVTNKIEYCNAGHNPPLLISSDGAVKELETTGMIAGVIQGYEYEAKTIGILPGDVLVIYSDGVTEAMNLNEEEYSDFRLIKLISENKNYSSEYLVDLVIEDVYKFSSGIPQSDDISLVIIKNTG